MGKPIRNLLIALVLCGVLGAGAWLLLREPVPQAESAAGGVLLQQDSLAVTRVQVTNAHGSYTVEQTKSASGGAYTVAVSNLDASLVNLEYVAMLLDEVSSIRYEELVTEAAADLSLYGLAKPEATVEAAYTDGKSHTLQIGAEEPISGGRYFTMDGTSAVYLMRGGSTVRFTMPVERFINYVIIAPNESTSVLSALQDITFSGKNFPQPVELKAVLEDRDDVKRISASFGAATHIITAPALHEANQTELQRVADSLFGLISEGIVAFNQTPEKLASYGFNEPLMQLEFDYKNGKSAAVEHHVLKVSQHEGATVVTLDEQGVVYRVADVAFLHTTYDSLILRWFLSPFITDVAELEVAFGEQSQTFTLKGATAKELLAYTADGAELDGALFKAYYNLVVSAAAEETTPKTDIPRGAQVLTLRFHYRDEGKPDDIITFYESELRRLAVDVNGTCLFTIREKYVETLHKATRLLLAGQSFEVNWQ